MAGLTLEQLQKMGAKPAKPVGLTLEELELKGAMVVGEEPKIPSYWSGQRLVQSMDESSQIRAEKIKASLAGSASPVKKTLDVGAQVVAGTLFDPVGNLISSLVPNWVKKRFAEGVEKTQEPIKKIMAEKYPDAPEGVSVTEKLAQKVDEPTQYMTQAQTEMFNQAQQMRDRAFNEPNPEKKKLLNETAAGMEQAVQEIGKTVKETESRREELARSAETTEILGTTGLMFTPKTVPTAKKQAGKIIDITLDKADNVYKMVTQNTPEQVEQQIARFYNKAVKPSVAGKMTISQANKAIGNQIVAISLINKNAPKLKFQTDAGLEVGRVPQTMQELADSVLQTKKGIFEQYNKLATASNQAGGKVELTSIADELNKIASNPVVLDNEPAVAKYAQNLANSYRARGEYDVLTTQDVIKLYNDRLSNFYKNPTPDYTSKAVVDAMVANKLREMTDLVIEQTKGKGYAELKKQYGALKSIEKEVVHRAIVDARKNTKGLIDFADIASAAQLINFVISGNVVALAQSATMKGMTAYYKYLNSTNLSLKKMFEAAAKLQKSQPKSSANILKPKITIKKAPTAIAKGGNAIKTTKTNNQIITKSTTKAPVKSSLTESIKKAKASGQSFDEWVKGQGGISYRGEGGSSGGGNYFTKDKEFANEFAGIKPLTEAIIPEKSIYRAKTLPEAVNEQQVTKAIAEAKSKGFKAFYVDEGMPFGEPIESIFVIDKSAIKTRSQLKAEWDKIK